MRNLSGLIAVFLLCGSVLVYLWPQSTNEGSPDSPEIANRCEDTARTTRAESVLGNFRVVLCGDWIVRDSNKSARNAEKLVSLASEEHRESMTNLIEEFDNSLSVSADYDVLFAMAEGTSGVPDLIIGELGTTHLSSHNADKMLRELAGTSICNDPGNLEAISLERSNSVSHALWCVLESGSAYMLHEWNCLSSKVRDDLDSAIVLTMSSSLKRPYECLEVAADSAVTAEGQ